MRKITITLVLLVLALTTLANTPRHSFIHISRKDGLASNDVYDICQDEKGFYWVATDNGLQRYDGKRWISPILGDPNSVPAKPVHQLISLNANRLLLKMGEAYGLFHTANFHFTAITIPPKYSRNVESYLWQDSRGNIFLICKGQAILWLDISGNKFVEKLPMAFDTEVKPLTIFEDVVNARYWIGGKNGLSVYDFKNKQTYTRTNNPLHLPLLSDEKYTQVSSFYIDTSRKHWIVYGAGKQQFACFGERENSYVGDVQNLQSYYKGTFEINHVFQSVEGEMWLYGRSALFNYEIETNEFYNNKSDISNSGGARFSVVRTIMQDREKGIWVATNEGLYQFYTVLPEVRNIILRTENDDNNVTDVEQMDNGDVWLASRGKGVLALNSTIKRQDVNYLFENASSSTAYATKHALDIHQQKSTGKIWIGCVQGSVIVADEKNKTSKVLQPAVFEGESVTQIGEDHSGKLWFGTQSGNIIMHDGNADLSESSFAKIVSVNSRVTKIMTDRQGALWICTGDNGLFSLDTRTKQITHHYRQEASNRESLSSNAVTDIVQINDTTYAIATELLDILNIKTKKVKQLSFHDGLLSNTILGMLSDRQGYLWIATSNGICRYNFARNKFTAYEEKDGFMQFETVGSAGTLLSDGNILFAGRNYFVTFPPELLNRSEAPPEVAITDIKVLNSFMPLDSSSMSMELEHDNNSITFYFSAMSYLLKDKLTYYYRLKGIDKDWVRADFQLAAIYTLLPSGNYTFEVKCENEEGVSSQVTSFSFVINPPFWKTWWFVALIIFAALALLFVLHRLRVKRIIALAELRNRVARDLHDDVGSTLSTISILSTIAKGQMETNPVQASDNISKITHNSQQMMDAMDDIVWSIKPMNDSMQKIVARMREFASGVLEPKDIDVEFYVDERVPHLKLNMEARRDLFLIFKEAVNNIAKYSLCTTVSIHINYNQKRLVLKIKDNGIGFNVDTADSGNGISNMRKRAAMMNGRIKWHSGAQMGTMVVLNIPVN